MANWSKRRSTKAGNQGQRITRTTNSSGKSTYSSSKRVDNTRTTTSISSSGKIKIYTTEHHPTLGTRRTTQTLNKQPRAKKPKAYKPKKSRAKVSSYSYSSNEPSPIFDWIWDRLWESRTWWWLTAFGLFVMGAAWYIWLIYFSAYLKFNVDFFK